MDATGQKGEPVGEAGMVAVQESGVLPPSNMLKVTAKTVACNTGPLLEELCHGVKEGIVFEGPNLTDALVTGLDGLNGQTLLVDLVSTPSKPDGLTSKKWRPLSSIQASSPVVFLVPYSLKVAHPSSVKKR